MARGILFPAGLKVLIAVLVLALVHQASSADDSLHHCASSSCGNIRNISYPFRLESDPEDCGNQSYTLACENNHPVLHFHSVKYYVQEINYTEYTIRVVESSIHERNGSFISPYSLVQSNFTSRDPYNPWSSHNITFSCDHSYWWIGYVYENYVTQVVLVNCEKPVISGDYWDISTCLGNGANFSNSSSSDSKRYRYLLVEPTLEDLEESCQVERASRRQWREHFGNTCTDFYDQVAQGLKLSWAQAMCQNFSVDGLCVLDDQNFRDWCQRHGSASIWRLYLKVGDITRKVEVWRTGKYDLVYDLVHDLAYSLEKQNIKARMAIRTGVELLLAIVSVGLYHQVAKTVLGAPFVVTFFIYKWNRRHLSAHDVIEEFLRNHNNLMPVRYSYSDIKKITKGFKDKLGEGGFGTVFKGTLRSGCLVAVKVLDKSKANGQDFISEVSTIGRIHHVNVVQLIGFCVEGFKQALVYEFMPNGSLNTYIFSPEVNTFLSYDKIFDVALGVAHGIEYLHQGCEMQILHFDIKPHNILLDKNLNPKVSDFGLAKLYAANEGIVSLTAIRGTLGYMAPELFYKNIGGILM